MALNKIVIKGAREHNLKNIDVEIPRDRFVVFTGLSGSGKSSLAFDTIYADGQRRYVESLSSYARMFLGQMEKPDVDSIEGLSPAISIDQKTTSKNPRSTVGTVTEIYDYLRLLYARIGVPHCPVCGRVIQQQTVDQIVDQIMELPEGSRIQILAPIVRGRKGEHKKELESAKTSGFVRVRIDGIFYDLSEDIRLEKNKKHNIEIVIDRLIVKAGIEARLTDSLESTMNISGGIVLVDVQGSDVQGSDELLFSQNYACPEHGVSIEELSPRLFSFNNPAGACEMCTGLGTFMKVDPALVVPDTGRSIRAGAIRASGWYFAEGGLAESYFEALAKHYHFSLDTPFRKLPKNIQEIILYGNGGEKIAVQRELNGHGGSFTTDFEGIVNNLERRFRTTTSNWIRNEIAALMSSEECPKCHGLRLKPEYLAVTVGGINIMEFCQMPIVQALEFIDNLKLNKRELAISAQILKGRFRLSHTRTLCNNPFRRREPAHPPCHPDRLVTDGGALYLGRTKHRTAPKG